MALIEVAHRVRVPMSDAAVRRVILRVIASVAKQSQPSGRARLSCRLDGRVGTPRNDGGVSVAFVGPADMRRLNRTYHGEDRITDILAFPNASSFRGAKRRGISHHGKAGRIGEISRFARDDGEWNIGELVVCPSYVKQQAKQAGEPFRRELTRVLIHGTLHLLGEDHATPRQAERMFGMQEEIVRKLFSLL